MGSALSGGHNYELLPQEYELEDYAPGDKEVPCTPVQQEAPTPDVSVYKPTQQMLDDAAARVGVPLGGFFCHRGTLYRCTHLETAPREKDGVLVPRVVPVFIDPPR